MSGVAACDACGAPMVWGKTSNGRLMPLDANPDGTLRVYDDGNVSLDAGRVTVWQQPGLFDGPRGKSHFATCPNAESFRRR